MDTADVITAESPWSSFRSRRDRAERVRDLVLRAMSAGGLTVEDAAREWTISRATVKRMLRGQIAWPPRPTLMRICRTAGVPLDEQFVTAQRKGPGGNRLPDGSTPFGAKLRELRIARGLTQLGFSRLAGLSHSGVMRLEAGTQKYVTAGDVKGVAEALGMDTAVLWATIPVSKRGDKWISLID